VRDLIFVPKALGYKMHQQLQVHVMSTAQATRDYTVGLWLYSVQHVMGQYWNYLYYWH